MACYFRFYKVEGKYMHGAQKFSHPLQKFQSRLAAVACYSLYAGTAACVSTILYIKLAFEGTMVDTAVTTAGRAVFMINSIGFLVAFLLKSLRLAWVNLFFLIILAVIHIIGALPCIAFSPGFDRYSNCGNEEKMLVGLLNVLILALANMRAAVVLVLSTFATFPFLVNAARVQQFEPFLAELDAIELSEVCIIRAPFSNWPPLRDGARVNVFSDLNPSWIGGETMPRYYLATPVSVSIWKFQAQKFSSTWLSGSSVFEEFCTD